MPHLDNTDSHTNKIGACNTVVRAQDGKLYGFNTDAAGVVRPLEQRISLEGAKILVLGAGGAARAAVFGLKERGCRGLYPQPQRSPGSEIGPAGAGANPQTSRFKKARLRRNHQRDSRWFGKYPRHAAR